LLERSLWILGLLGASIERNTQYSAHHAEIDWAVLQLTEVSTKMENVQLAS